MSRWISRTLAHIGPALITLALASSPLFAVGPGDGLGGGGGGEGGSEGEQPAPSPVPVTPGDVPEINPSTAVSALILLAGGTLLLTDQVRRRNSPRPDRVA